MRYVVVSLILIALVASHSASADTIPQFRSYPAPPIYSGPSVPPNLSSQQAKQYRTRLRDGAAQPANFNGHYRMVIWGCGTECVTGAVIDKLNGHVFFLPFSICCSTDQDANFKAIEFRLTSRLLVFSGLRNEIRPDGDHFYEFDGERFVFIKSIVTHELKPNVSQEGAPPTADAAPDAQTPSVPTAPTKRPAPKAMNVIDFLVDWKDLVGETVIVTGCLIKGADTSRVLCWTGPQGYFRIDSKTLAREDLRRSLRNCAGLTERDECRVDVTGNVTENAIGDPELTDAAMNWAATLAPQQTVPKPTASPGRPEPSYRDGEISEGDFISVINAARGEYKNASNDFTKGAARVNRRERLCQFATDFIVREWTGTIAKLSSSYPDRRSYEPELTRRSKVKTRGSSGD